MLTLKNFMESVNYRITESSQYCWNCFGYHAHSFDSWNGDQNGYSIGITFDTNTQEVYSVEAHDYKHNRAYRMINPDYKKAHDDEAKSRGVNADEAYDEIMFTDLEVDDDMLDKIQAIVAGEDYDTRISVPIELPDAELLSLFKLAHEADMTFNDFVVKILTNAMESKKG